MTFGNQILAAASKYQVDPRLLCAVIAQESGGNPNAIRYEPIFFKQYVQNVPKEKLIGYVPVHCEYKTEKHARSTSWGLMQIMGQVAREKGFRGEFLSELLDPAVNLDIGARYLKHLLDTRPNVEAALLRWNGGGNENYAKEVLARLDQGECLELLARVK